MKCPYCGQEHSDNSKFCSETGKPLQSQTKKCEKCGYENVPVEAKFCPRCGGSFSFGPSNEVDSWYDGDKSQIIIFCYEAGTIIQIGKGHKTENCIFQREKQIKLKKGKNVICVKEFPELEYGFSFCSFGDNSEYIESIDLENYDTSHITDMRYMFTGCFCVKFLDLSRFDTSNVIYMDHMFSFCISLESLDLSSFDTSNVTDMSGMFSDCSSLETLDLSSFDISNVKEMNHMFYGCSSLLYLNLSSFKINTIVASIFTDCKSLRSLNLTRIFSEMSYSEAFCAAIDWGLLLSECISLKEIIMTVRDNDIIDIISGILKESNINAKIISD